MGLLSKMGLRVVVTFLVSFALHAESERGFTDGKMVQHFGVDLNYSRAITADSNGRLVIGGAARDPITMDLIVSRYGADADLDSEFGTGSGFAWTDKGSRELVHSVIVDESGRVVFGGRSLQVTTYRAVVGRLTSDGNFDTTFSGDGLISILHSNHGYIRGVAVDSNARAVVGGYTKIGTNFDMILLRYQTNGNLDTTFSTDGLVTTSIGQLDESTVAVELQADGDVITAGISDNKFSDDFVIVRYLSNGAKDTTFHSDGVASFSFGNNDGTATQVEAVDIELDSPDSNTTYSTLLDGVDEYIRIPDDSTLALTSHLTVSAWAKGAAQSNNTIVGHYEAGTNHRAWRLSSGSASTNKLAVVVSEDGTYTGSSIMNYESSIVAFDTTGWHHLVFTFSTGALNLYVDGTLDTTPTITTDGGVTALHNSTFALTIGSNLTNNDPSQPFAGNIDEVSIWDTALTAADVSNVYNSGSPNNLHTHAKAAGLVGWWRMGDLDDAKAISGYKDHGNSRDDWLFGVTTDSENRILMAGHSHNRTDRDVGIIRLLTSGLLDTTFSNDGKVRFAVTASQNDAARGVKVDELGRIAIAGATSDGTDVDFAFARLLTDGNFDTTFSSDGIATVSFNGAKNDYAMGLHLQGSLLIGAGITFDSNNQSDAALARLHYDGTGADGGDLDQFFSSDGKAVYFGATSDVTNLYGAEAQSDGKIYAVGHRTGIPRTAIIRILTNGALDTLFHSDGLELITIDSDGSEFYGVDIMTNGRPIAVGRTMGIDEDFAIIRYLTDGNEDTTFHTDGIIVDPIGTGSDVARDVILQSDEKPIVVGYTALGTNYGVAIVRYQTNGALDTTFSTDGVVTTQLGTGDSFAFDVKLDGDKIVIGGSSKGSSTAGDFLIARYLSSGALDTTFDGDGAVVTQFAVGEDRAYAIHVESDSKIWAAGYVYNGSNNDFAIARYQTNGALDTTFSTDGTTTVAIGTDADVGQVLLRQGDYKTLVGGYSHDGTDEKFAVIRLLTNGNLDSSFSTDGIQTYTIGTTGDRIYAGTIDEKQRAGFIGVTFGGNKNDGAMIRIVP